MREAGTARVIPRSAPSTPNLPGKWADSESMGRILLWRLTFLAFLAPAFVRGADVWDHLKIGMTAEETAAVIGAPLFRSAGSGFELWIYDHHAEVVFFGSLIGWTTPATDQRIGHAVDVWQGDSGGTTGPTFLSAIPAWYPGKNAASPGNMDVGGYDRLPTYRFHR